MVVILDTGFVIRDTWTQKANSADVFGRGEGRKLVPTLKFQPDGRGNRRRLSWIAFSPIPPFTDQANDPLIGNPVLQKPDHPLVIDFVEE